MGHEVAKGFVVCEARRVFFLLLIILGSFELKIDFLSSKLPFLRHIMPFSDGFKIGTTLEGGYIFNVGDRKGTQKLLYGDVTDSISYNLVDRGQYFLKGAIQAIGDNMAMEFGYHYTKSDKVKDNKWYVNADFKF